MRNSKTICLLVLLLLAAACGPLHKTQRHSITDSTSLDRSEIRKAVTDVLHEWGTLSQTVVEFYPPTITSPTELPEPHMVMQDSLPCRRAFTGTNHYSDGSGRMAYRSYGDCGRCRTPYRHGQHGAKRYTYPTAKRTGR